jgi:hypothetical protein
MSILFPPLKIEIVKKEVLRLIGARKNPLRINRDLDDIVDKEISRGREILRFKGAYLKLKVDSVTEDGVILTNGAKISSEKLARWVKNCDYLYLFVVTAGPLFSERISQLLTLGKVSLALVADAVGSTAAEGCARAANEYIASLEKGGRLTKRYSPGYGDWKVEDNRILLQWLEAQKIGITVNEGGLMIPEKSVSAAIGVASLN